MVKKIKDNNRRKKVSVEMLNDPCAPEEEESRNFDHPAKNCPIKTSLIYIVLSSFWILVSDKIAEAIVSDAAALTIVQTVKGWLFVLASGILIYYLIKRDITRLILAYTKLMKAESKLRKHSRELESRVAERTDEIVKANSQLQERFDEMEKLHKMTINREIKMIELKEQIAELKSRN